MATTATRSTQQRRPAAGISRSTAQGYYRTGQDLLAPPTTRPTRQIKRTGRWGSKQASVSVRGRRVVAHKYPSKTGRLLAFAVFAVAAGIAVVMWVSGLTTAQSFRIADAKKQSTTLANEIESLERDAQFVKSGANLAKEAKMLGMVAPDQSGVVDARGADIVEVRQPGVGQDREITDVNSDARLRGATSDPEKTDHVAGLAPREAVVAGIGADVSVPYSQNRSAPASALPPAPAPGPALPPAPALGPVPAPAPAPAPAPVAPPA